jgi:predicted transcriptional regulator
MAALTLKLGENELNAIKDYARLYNESVSAVVRRAIMERIEDEFDYRVGVEAWNEFVADGMQGISFDDYMKKAGLR